MEEASERNRIVGGGRYRQRIFAADVARIVQSSLSVPQLAKEYGMAPTYIARIRRENPVWSTR
jgi:hypothetical protein